MSSELPDTVALAVLRRLTMLDTDGGAYTRLSVHGYPEGQVTAALAELRRAGHVDGLQVTEKGRKLLEDSTK